MDLELIYDEYLFKTVFSIYDLKRFGYQCTVRWTMQGLTEPFFGCSNFTEAKTLEVCAVLLDKELFLKNQTTLATNCPSDSQEPSI